MRSATLMLLTIALVATSCSTSPTVSPTQVRQVPTPYITDAEEQAGIDGMLETYNLLVQAYAEASSPPVDPDHPVIQARTRGAAKVHLDRYHQSLVDAGQAEANSADERVIVEVVVLSTTTGRVRECSTLMSDLIDVETGEVADSVGELAFSDNFYVFEDGVWKLDHWGDVFLVESLESCPSVPSLNPRTSA